MAFACLHLDRPWGGKRRQASAVAGSVSSDDGTITPSDCEKGQAKGSENTDDYVVRLLITGSHKAPLTMYRIVSTTQQARCISGVRD